MTLVEKQHYIPTQNQKEIALALNLDPLIIHLAELRKYKGIDSISAFLFPSLTELPDPFDMSDMKKAVSLVFRAMKMKSEILIWGDYDVDGITGTCLLIRFFKSIGVKVKHYIPDRFADGYGLNCSALKIFRNDISSEDPLLITVDCGISNHREILYAKKLGYKVIVTDHHEPGKEKLVADATLNPKKRDCSFPAKNIAGVGVAFYLAAGIRAICEDDGYFNATIKKPNLKNFLDFVAIGTIADIVPLLGTNRVLVRAGFESLLKESKPGIQALLHSCGINGQIITADDISFQLAPKINAAGRMGNAALAVELLLCDEPIKAKKLANKLSRINQKRKITCQENLERALDIPENRLIYCDNCIILKGDFHLGVVGIVASQLAEKKGLPTVLLTETVDMSGEVLLKGSGRSDGVTDLFECLSSCKELLVKFGGHKMAAGLSLKKENFGEFRKKLSDTIADNYKNLRENKQIENVTIDIEKIFDRDILKQYILLEPFGEGNRQPHFCIENPVLCKSSLIGKGSEHLKIVFRGKYENHEGVGFGLGHKRSQLSEKESNKIIFTPMLNRFKDNTNWKVKVIDII
ncbi:MAG: single-stranded-DNA-specific exonuclease RecJ [Bacteroidetes bacterium]|nr:single-stranded-DNA-specific exonuclease RecJ [Bacteroidota bacterium]